VDPVAKQIGAVNTLVRQPDGSLKGYNTDYAAAIDAIEDAMERKTGTPARASLEGKTVVVIGAGGAGRALAFGAKFKGANVVIANRSIDRARALAEACGGVAVTLEDLANGGVKGDVLANTTSVGMQPNVDDTPAPASALQGYSVVFDAVYTPLETRLLREAKEAGCEIASGLDMFVGQAARQFELFTGKQAQVELMRETVLSSIK
jgi:3-dehydroquinate dehydratase/shikimate dehydrogenase